MKGLFQTQSLNVVAWLISKGFIVRETIVIDNKNVFFFDKNKNLLAEIENYNGNLELKKFIASFRKVKKIIKSQ